MQNNTVKRNTTKYMFFVSFLLVRNSENTFTNLEPFLVVRPLQKPGGLKLFLLISYGYLTVIYFVKAHNARRMHYTKIVFAKHATDSDVSFRTFKIVIVTFNENNNPLPAALNSFIKNHGI